MVLQSITPREGRKTPMTLPPQMQIEFTSVPPWLYILLGAVLVLWGAANILFGCQKLRVLLTIPYALVGFGAVVGLLGHYNPGLAVNWLLCTGALGGVILGALAYMTHRPAIFFVGFACCAGATFLLIRHIGWAEGNEILRWLLVIAVGVAGGGIFLKLRQPVFVLNTSIFGSVSLVVGVLIITGGGNEGLQALTNALRGTYHPLLPPFGALGVVSLYCLIIMGVVVQTYQEIRAFQNAHKGRLQKSIDELRGGQTDVVFDSPTPTGAPVLSQTGKETPIQEQEPNPPIFGRAALFLCYLALGGALGLQEYHAQAYLDLTQKAIDRNDMPAAAKAMKPIFEVYSLSFGQLWARELFASLPQKEKEALTANPPNYVERILGPGASPYRLYYFPFFASLLTFLLAMIMFFCRLKHPNLAKIILAFALFAAGSALLQAQAVGVVNLASVGFLQSLHLGTAADWWSRNPMRLYIISYFLLGMTVIITIGRPLKKSEGPEVNIETPVHHK